MMDEVEAKKFLESRGYVLHPDKGWKWRPKRGVVTEWDMERNEYAALVYLHEEWDFGGLEMPVRVRAPSEAGHPDCSFEPHVEYEILEHEDFLAAFYVISPRTGDPCFCLWRGCAHLLDSDWEPVYGE